MPPSRRVRDLLLAGEAVLRQAGLESARREVEWLLSRLVGVPALELYLREDACAPLVAERFYRHVQERAAGRPLQYVLGEGAFFGRAFAVVPGVFIPRPETEAVLSQVMDPLRALAEQRRRPLELLDAGTGSGCIAVTLACELPACLVVGVEVSWEAVQVARRNAEQHGVSRRVRFVQGSWLDAVSGTWDAIIANPPYIPSARVDQLPLDVRAEPRRSLDGGQDGMDALIRLLDAAPRALRAGGLLALECGEEQAAPLCEAAQRAGWPAACGVLRDLAQRPRGVLVRRA